VGKTRLALVSAAELHSEFADGVVFVSLAPIRDPHLVISAIAHALGLRQGALKEMHGTFTAQQARTEPIRRPKTC
jgi:predicted ATPase